MARSERLFPRYELGEGTIKHAQAHPILKNREFLRKLSEANLALKKGHGRKLVLVDFGQRLGLYAESMHAGGTGKKPAPRYLAMVSGNSFSQRGHEFKKPDENVLHLMESLPKKSRANAEGGLETREFTNAEKEAAADKIIDLAVARVMKRRLSNASPAEIRRIGKLVPQIKEETRDYWIAQKRFRHALPLEDFINSFWDKRNTND